MRDEVSPEEFKADAMSTLSALLAVVFFLVLIALP